MECCSDADPRVRLSFRIPGVYQETKLADDDYRMEWKHHCSQHRVYLHRQLQLVTVRINEIMTRNDKMAADGLTFDLQYKYQEPA